MSTLVVIPDIHQDWDWAAAIIESYGPDQRFVFTGDYYDFRRARTYSHEEACDKLRYWMNQLEDRAVWLMGNHDAQYHPLNEALDYRLSCMGFNGAAAEYLTVNTDWSRIRLAHAEQGFLFTHAGLGYLPPLHGLLTPEALAEALNSDWAEMDARNPYPYLIQPGQQSGGRGEGGPFWHRPEEGPLLPVNQMMGHTVHVAPAMRPSPRYPHAQHWYLDCLQTYWVELDAERVNICTFE